MPLRVVQWTTENVGWSSLRSLVDNPLFELVGCYAYSDAKIGRDAGELVGIDPVGIAATNDIDALIALKPDCVAYNPLWSDVDEMVRILESGINIVSTAGFITGHALGEGGTNSHRRSVQARGSSIFGSGMYPGFLNMLALAIAGVCGKVERITTLESVDSTFYSSPETEGSVGFGLPIDNPELPAMVREGTAVFADAVRMMADALRVELDDVVCEPNFAMATQDLDLGYMEIPKGCVAGVEACWQAQSGDRAPIELKVRWRKGQHLEPDWEVEHGHVVEVEGEPGMKTKLQIQMPSHVFEGGADLEALKGIGLSIVSLPAVNAIPAVCAAAPGIVTYKDLPLITGAGWIGR